jgi:hypothetical protein
VAKKVTQKKRVSTSYRLPAYRTNDGEKDAFSILEFCSRHGLSTGLYYILKRKGKGPRELRIQGRILVTKEAASDWRRARELETSETA